MRAAETRADDLARELDQVKRDYDELNRYLNTVQEEKVQMLSQLRKEQDVIRNLETKYRSQSKEMHLLQS